MTLSQPHTKPKVFRVPAAKPRPVHGAVQKLYETVKMTKPVIAIISVVAVIILAVPAQSPQASKGEEQKSDSSEDTFTFLESQAPADTDSDQPFVITGKNAKIVGQITQISGEKSELKQIKATPDVDNKAHRDLLSVVNKY